MKKRIALMLAFVLCLSLCACGQEAAPDQKEQDTSNLETQAQSATAETTAEGYYVQKKTMEDGTNVTIYRYGGPEGAIVTGFLVYPDGAQAEERYNSEGVLEYTIYIDVDGSTYETFFYPSGCIAKDVMNSADGSYSEVHFMDNGTIDEETGVITSGTICYEKYVTADGQVEEYSYDITVDDDGTRWNTEEWDDGTVVRTHYSANGMPIEQIQDNEATGDHTEIKYYENGSEMTRDSYYADHGIRSYLEYYENGSVKYSLLEYDSGGKSEERINEAGYTTYYYDNFDNTSDKEFFANDVGELVKYIEDGTVYENSAIPSSARDIFNQVRQVPAEGTTTTQNEDGSSSTTTTYADGSSMTSGTTADGTFTNESISANGDRYYEEYYASGTLKLMISETADTYQEVHYDEDGYWIYFHLVAPGYEQEITCDETGKVDKVLVNGQVQTDIEQHVQGMFFRSW